MFPKTVLLVVFLYSGIINGATSQYYTTNTEGPSTSAAGCGVCGTCPPGYSTYQMNNHGQCRCLCEYTGYYYQASSTPQYVGRGVLMQLLRNLQTNAAALEQMASGVSDEANIAESVANSSK